MTDTLLDRFLRYVKIDTTSTHNSDTYPSTAKQYDLLKLLVDELQALGLADAVLNERGYVYATIPATTDAAVPTIAYLAHVDTAPDYSGTNVKPIVHENYQGQVIRLPEDPAQVLDPGDPRYDDLLTAVGKDVVTSSGDTLLGADDKAGVAVVMTLIERLMADTSIPHGPIRICFTPDEEVGAGVKYLELDDLGANAAYTLDGGAVGELSWETFSADGAQVTIRGVSTHPGTAHRYGMVNAVHLAGKLLAMLPREFASPEATEKRAGFIHPVRISGDAAETIITFILRDHDNDKLAQKGEIVRKICAALEAAHPGARIAVDITTQYRNMGEWMGEHMLTVELAEQACRRAGVEPWHNAVRGGTDGSRLTQRGLPTPNIFCGGHNAHGPLEWVAVQDMEKAVDVLVELAQLWVEQGPGFRGYQPGH